MSALLYGPSGARLKRRDVVELPWGIMQRFIEFSDLAQKQGLGVHCSKCAEDIAGGNSEHDPVLKVSCGCREFWSTNPRIGRA